MEGYDELDLKAIGWKVYLAITKESYLSNSMHLEANAQALEALRKSPSKEYLNMILLAQGYNHSVFEF